MFIAYKNITFFMKKAAIVATIASVSLSSQLTLSNIAKAAPQGAYADKYASIVVDANSGRTLFQSNANARRYPASLTKMMTLYMLFEAMQSGRVTPNTPIPVSAYAASRPPTKIGFRAGETIRVESAIKALVTRSANDVAAAIGEYLAGSEQNFARAMTKKARSLGMMNTNFANASGLPDVDNYSTARDMAILSIALRDNFPQQYKYFKTTSFVFRGKRINGHNDVLEKVKGVDGIKTGYTSMSGSNLATSMRLNGRSIVAVVMGGRTSALRDAHMTELLKRYLPKASTKKTRVPLMASLNLPTGRDAPIPVAKADIMNDDISDNALLTALASQSPIERSAFNALNNAIIPSPTLKKPNNVDIDMTTTASIKKYDSPKPAGWAIQIGSLPNQQQAEKMLAKASGTARTILADASPYTQIFDQNGQRFYRARFVGFNSKQDAWDACSALKKADFHCYAILQ